MYTLIFNISFIIGWLYLQQWMINRPRSLFRDIHKIAHDALNDENTTDEERDWANYVHELSATALGSVLLAVIVDSALMILFFIVNWR